MTYNYKEPTRGSHPIVVCICDERDLYIIIYVRYIHVYESMWRLHRNMYIVCIYVCTWLVCICVTYMTHSWIRLSQIYVYVIYIPAYTRDLWDIHMWRAHVYDFSFTRTCDMCMRIHVTYIHIYTHIHMRILKVICDIHIPVYAYISYIYSHIHTHRYIARIGPSDIYKRAYAYTWDIRD